MILKTATLASAPACTSAAVAVGFIGASTAAAEVTTTTLGSDAQLVDGSIVPAWTVSDLKPSIDVIDYPVLGTLWEAVATDTAVAGAVTPIVSNFDARARNGEAYRVLFETATPQGVNPATLAQGQQTTGKLYFDVTGANPDSVVYNSVGTDLLLWVAVPPASRQSTPAAAPGSAAVDAVQERPPLGAAGAAEDVPGADVPTGSQGTPLSEGSQGTPIEAGVPGSSAPSIAPAAPQTAAEEPPAAAQSSQGTPATQRPRQRQRRKRPKIGANPSCRDRRKVSAAAASRSRPAAGTRHPSSCLSVTTAPRPCD